MYYKSTKRCLQKDIKSSHNFKYFKATSYLVVVGGAAVVVSGAPLGSDVAEKTRSEKSGKMDEVVVVETGGAVALGGAIVFIR